MDQRRQPPERGHNATRIRAQNVRMVLGIVRQAQAISRAEIARQTGLSPPAVSAIMAELEGAGHVEKKSRRKGNMGTPSTLYGIRRGSAFSIGLHIGRRSTSAVLQDLSGAVIREAEHPYLIPQVCDVVRFIDATIKAWGASLPDLETRLLGVGICTPQIFDFAAQDIGYPDTIAAEWAAFDAATAFAPLCDVPVFVENDVNAAALAELEWGEGAAARDFFYINIGTFIGAGLVLDGALLRGPQGLAATFGPFPVAPSRLASATTPRGDFDYLFRRASLFVLLEHLRHGGFPVIQESALAALDEVCAPLVAEWVDDAARALAQAIQGVVAIIDVGTVIIDSPLPRDILAALVEQIQQALDANAGWMIVRPRILPGTAGAHPSARGAAMVPFSEVLGIGPARPDM